MDDPIDTITPWTIKACPTRTRERVVAAAQRENLTVGQWLERRVNEWEAGGSPVPVRVAGNPVSDLVAIMQAAGSLPTDVGIPREVRALINELAREARAGLPRQKPGQPVALLE